MQFEWLEIDRLTPELMMQWRRLGFAASTPNVYLMPEFMVPAIRYLERDKRPRIAVLWDAERRDMLALGAFNCVAPSLRFPVPRLNAVKSKHSFQTGVLLRAGIGAEAVDRFVGALLGTSWWAMRFEDLREDALVHRQLQASATRLGLTWLVDRRYTRAALELDGSAWREHISRSRHRCLRRTRAKLAKRGKVEFRLVEAKDVCDRDVEAFLRLESKGWKRRSALLARPNDAQFFREVVQSFRELELLFVCELLLDGQAIASTTNFCVNGHGFAFKIGYDPEYRSYGPGFLVEYGFLETIAEAITPIGLREIESGSEEGSFIEHLWPKRISMVSGHMFAGKLPTAFGLVRQTLKQAGRGKRAPTSAQQPAPQPARTSPQGASR